MTERETDVSDDAVARLTEEELAALVEQSVRRSMLDVLGTVLLLGFSLLFLGIGARGLLTATTTVGIAIGLAAIAGGLALAAAAFGLIPPFRD